MQTLLGSSAPGLVPRHPPAVPGVKTPFGFSALGWTSSHSPGCKSRSDPAPGLDTMHPPGHPGVQILPRSSTPDWECQRHWQSLVVPTLPRWGPGLAHSRRAHPHLPGCFWGAKPARVQHAGAAVPDGVQQPCQPRGAHPSTVPHSRYAATPGGAQPDGVLHPRARAPRHPSAANPEGAALLCKEGLPNFPGLSLLGHFVLHGWGVCVFLLLLLGDYNPF